MDECTSCVEEINSKLTTSSAFPWQQNLAVQAAGYNDTAPPTMFMAGNGAMSGTLIPNSASSSELARESRIMEEVQYTKFFSHNYSITSGRNCEHIKYLLRASPMQC